MLRTIISWLLLLVVAVPLPIFGCRDEGSNGRGRVDDSVARNAAAERLAIIAMERHSRSAAEVAQRAADVVEVLVGSPVSASEAISWAEEATVDRHLGAGALPFSAFPEVSVHYTPYTDMLVVRDQTVASDLARLVAEGTQSGAPEPGVGKLAAIREADRVFGSMTGLSYVDASWSMIDSYRVQQGFVDAGVPHRWVRDYVLEYRRHIEGVPLLDTTISITVHRSGEVAEIAIADIQANVIGHEVPTLDAEDAADAFRAAAEMAVAHFDPAPSTLIKSPRVAYTIPEAEESGDRGPEYVAGIVYRYGDFHAPLQLGVVALSGSDHSLRILERYQAEPLPPADAGAACGVDTDCVSGRCYVFDGYYGFCGECASDADCPSGGCNPPDPVARPPVPSSCGQGVQGDGCESSTSCRPGLECGVVARAALGYELKTCGGCADDLNCTGGELCEPVLDVSEHRAYLACAGSGSRGLGSVCTRDAACASGHCAELRFPDGSTVGVCSECSQDVHCTGICEPPGFELGVGFSGGYCST